MSKVKFKLNYKGVRALLQSQAMLNVVKKHADEIQQRAGGGYEATAFGPGKTRVNASVRATTRKAIKDNLKNNTLLKAMR